MKTSTLKVIVLGMIWIPTTVVVAGVTYIIYRLGWPEGTNPYVPGVPVDVPADGAGIVVLAVAGIAAWFSKRKK